ncbi:MAG: Glu-tRNA(Gln) amidotransferase GatDE subunit E [Calditrichaeota bacterium]|nr:MAG: Glu-tRNA(Gln) amidotransferase GatDE subunit E [Calditrichota bacterium]
MNKEFDSIQNYEDTKNAINYVEFEKATKADYQRIGFKCGLEIHQQLKTEKKLFCRCPASVFQAPDDYDAEIIRHMRPTLSELGEYDGTALMEFKTRKNITYRIKNETACTYEIDDTPPFRINKQALGIAIKISLLCKQNIVGELHIIRKQYLDGSIPTGFQRTGIVGIEGEIPLRDKTVHLIQLSIEEDSCREVSDIGHERIYRTDRLGMPLIEAVTYPELLTPAEAAEAAHYLRFLFRSTGEVCTGMGASREDVNVSAEGGTRVEIKGVAHIKWIPKLTHIEAYRQVALLKIKDELNNRISKPSNWNINSAELDSTELNSSIGFVRKAKEENKKLIAVNLPDFKSILSHFTQPGKTFANEISDRLKVIACLEHPNMLTSEMPRNEFFFADGEYVKKSLNASNNDAQIIFWTDEYDRKTALETIEERCRMAFEGVPNETRKGLPDGTTIFERVLPGADRMYPDTDSAPIAIEQSWIDDLKNELPPDVSEEKKQLSEWKVPESSWTYLLKNNLMPLMRKIVSETGFTPSYVCKIFAENLKHLQGQTEPSGDFTYSKVLGLFRFIKEQNLVPEIAEVMLEELYKHPNILFDSLLEMINFKKRNEEKIKSYIPLLKEKFEQICTSKEPDANFHWIMGQIRPKAIGNLPLSEVALIVKEAL